MDVFAFKDLKASSEESTGNHIQDPFIHLTNYSV